MMKSVRVFLIPAILFTTAFLCKESDPEGSYDDTLSDLEDLILSEIGQARANDLSECRAVAFGSKPCGGPWSYLVYSSSDSDEEQLLRLIDRYNDLEFEVNDIEGRSSDCSVPLKPNLELRNNQCLAVSP